MTVRKVIPEDKSPKQNEELDYDVWIDINLKNICNKGRGRIEYVSRKNGQPNKFETQKIIDELSTLDLADANALTATLTKKGEEVCKAGGWIEWNKQKENQSSSFEPTINHQTPSNTERKQSKRHATIVILMILGILVALFIAYMQGLFHRTA